MMSILAYLLGTATLIWAMLPLFKKDSTWISLIVESDALEDQKKRVYGNITDLEFDYAMGRLSEPDFNKIRQSFLREAGRVIQKLEDQKSADLIAQIEQDVKQLNNGKSKNNKKHICKTCGKENLPSARFCMECGQELT
ncbi:MAG: zinc ribbon domain-containing protein [Candidatus Marinimicrobia bacterium]|nr:zinc ribbon domain-containing protein [Candidatus Neomarinimicrobiota bacterium]